MKIGIVGLGLMGGSLAKALKKNSSHLVLGVDKDSATLKKALEERSIDEVLDDKNLSQCELVVLAVRPGIAKKFAKENSGKIQGILLDFCGIKRSLEEEILPLAIENQFIYLGGHPMAGRERG